MKKLLWLLLLLAPSYGARADRAYGSLNNFDCVNDTGQTCYGFLIELEDVRSTDITYTYDWNHYGAPRIGEDLVTDPTKPRTLVYYEAKKNPDGSFASFTNPLDPVNHPIGATSGHDCTNPSVNYGCEHFGIGLYKMPTRVKYNWLIENPTMPGTLMVGPIVTISAPSFVYVPPPAPAAPAQVQAVIEPPEPAEPEPGQWGPPVWVKIFKTVQPVGKFLKLDELVTDDETDPNDVHWDGGEQPETEFEWTVFQKRPPGDEAEDELKGSDDLPEGDEMVTRRYEFYEYLGPVNEEDGEAQCDNPDNCPGAVGQYIGAQMAGFNVEAPLGLIDHLQDGTVSEAYVDRRVVVGGNTPYTIQLLGALPQGMDLDTETGILNGTPLVPGSFTFKVSTTDADQIKVEKEYTLKILSSPLEFVTTALPDAEEAKVYSVTLQAQGGRPDYLWSVDALPAGLSLSETGTITGSPLFGTAGNYAPVFTVIDQDGTSVSQALTFVIKAAPKVRGDIDGDRDVDRNDLALVLAARNKPASGPNDPRDLDKDGRITILDARLVTVLFSTPGGEISRAKRSQSIQK